MFWTLLNKWKAEFEDFWNQAHKWALTKHGKQVGWNPHGKAPNRVYAMILKCSFGNSGGGSVEIAGKYIGKIGGHYVSTNLREGWVSRIWSSLMRRCWPNKCGGCILTDCRCFIECLVPNFFLLVRCLQQKNPKGLTHGKAYGRQGRWSRKECSGELGMRSTFSCFMTTGYQVSFQQKLFPTT